MYHVLSLYAAYMQLVSFIGEIADRNMYYGLTFNLYMNIPRRIASLVTHFTSNDGILTNRQFRQLNFAVGALIAVLVCKFFIF